MLKFIFRHTIYKHMTKESMDRYFKLAYPREKFIFIFCALFWCGVWILYNILFLIVVMITSHKQEVQFTEQFIIMMAAVICTMISSIFCKNIKTLREKYEICALRYSSAAYANNYIYPGKAVNFKLVAKRKPNLCSDIYYGFCRGYCYKTCFDLLKIMQTGCIEFLAARKFSFEMFPNGAQYSIHVLYVNNGYAFDTFSQLQLPLSETHELWEAKIWKRFSYDELKSKSYMQFKEEVIKEMEDWCKANNVCQYWSV